MSDWAQTIVLGGAVLTAIGYALRVLWRGFRVIERLYQLVEHELKPNSGSSMYDKVTRLDEGFTQHLQDSAIDHQLLAEHDALLAERGQIIEAHGLRLDDLAARVQLIEEFLVSIGYQIRRGRP